MDITKYKQRGGWSHRDLLRLAHPSDEEYDEVFCYAVKGWEGLMEKKLKRKTDDPDGDDPPRSRVRTAGSGSTEG